MPQNPNQHDIEHRRHARDELRSQRERAADPAERAVIDADRTNLARVVLARDLDDEQRTTWANEYADASGEKWTAAPEQKPVPRGPSRPDLLDIETRRLLEENSAGMSLAERAQARELFELEAASAGSLDLGLTDRERAAALVEIDDQRHRAHLAELQQLAREHSETLDEIATNQTIHHY